MQAAHRIPSILGMLALVGLLLVPGATAAAQGPDPAPQAVIFLLAAQTATFEAAGDGGTLTLTGLGDVIAVAFAPEYRSVHLTPFSLAYVADIAAQQPDPPPVGVVEIDNAYSLALTLDAVTLPGDAYDALVITSQQAALIPWAKDTAFTQAFAPALLVVEVPPALIAALADNPFGFRDVWSEFYCAIPLATLFSAQCACLDWRPLPFAGGTICLEYSPG